MKLFPLVLCALFWQISSAQNIGVIPLPQVVTISTGQFQLHANAMIGVNDMSLLSQVNYLQTNISQANGITLPVDPDESKAVIDLKLIKKAAPAGSYSLSITQQKVTITAPDAEGVFHGIITLLQLIRAQPVANPVLLPLCEITDAPRFQWRGFMLDESRHFFGKEKVKQLLDWMALYKLNRFHWHLTDVDGWRVEIKKYPKLTTIGAIGNHTDTVAAAQYYTQNDIHEIVAYAQARFITVIPEIDMPGHATAANRAYPQFDGGSYLKYRHFTFNPAVDSVYTFLGDILREVNGMFPSGMIHLGGDEVALGIQAWAGQPAISAMIEKHKFTGLSDLEHYFFQRMADSVTSMGDKVLCWDEAASTDLPADQTIVFWWRQNVPSQLELALQKKYSIVLCPRLPLYFDFVQDKSHISGRRWNNEYFNTVSDIYNFPDRQMPVDEINTSQVLGIQANIWTETVGSAKRLDFMIFPRLAALAESAWTNAGVKNEASFNERLKDELTWYDKAGIYYFNPFDPSAHPEPIDFMPVVPKPAVRDRRHHKHHDAHHGHKDGKAKHKGSAGHSKKTRHRHK